jgi:hypothetical protein
VLQQFCDARYQNVYNGRQMTEEEITGLLIAVLFAGQHTSSITSSWTGYFMINDKVRGAWGALSGLGFFWVWVWVCCWWRRQYAEKTGVPLHCKRVPTGALTVFCCRHWSCVCGFVLCPACRPSRLLLLLRSSAAS